MGTHRSQRDGTVGPATRPVAVPPDLDDPAIGKAAGLVGLPLRIRWSHPRRAYDLAVRSERALVYEQVLAEGTEQDVQRFVGAEDLLDLWDDLVLPDHVRRAWAPWVSARQARQGPC